MNPLVELQTLGQSFWYDNIRRKYLVDGTILKLIDEDGLRGMTSNPSIFENAIGAGNDYDEQIIEAVKAGKDVESTYETLAITDIRMACDLFAGIFEKTDGVDGYVSLEVSPYLAHDEKSTVAEAQRLFATVDRPNVLIKVPATKAGIPAIRNLIGQGININITLMFSMEHYEAVAQAYIDGLRQLKASGGKLEGVASVASFFVSRVDSAVDKQLSSMDDPASESLMGKTAVANSKLVYKRFKDIFHGDSFEPLRESGARVQRLLWASTSTKNPQYPDTLYVDDLIGPETVNTMPPKTIDAFRDHGRVANSLEHDLGQARQIIDRLGELDIKLSRVTEQLQKDGVEAFSDSYTKLLSTLRWKAGNLT
jgi:transaldolase/transaldolase/glucose-6-phosphate isomerase